MSKSDSDFCGLQGHGSLLARLRKGGRRKPFPSLVFGGASGVGKRLTAIWYAAFLNCYDQDENAPCGRCASCNKMASLSHPDLHLTRVPEKKTVVGVSEVREAIHEIHHAPFEGSFRVWVIEDGERLTDEAQNCLLKTLEEPPERAVIVIVSSLEGALIPTVASRCRLFRFSPLEVSDVQRALTEQGADSEEAQLFALNAGGRFGVAYSLFANPEMMSTQQEVLDCFLGLPGKSLGEALEIAQTLEKQKSFDTHSLLSLGMSAFRDLMLLSVGADGLLSQVQRREQLESLASELSLGRIQEIMAELREAEEFSQRNVSARLNLQRLCIRISKVA